MAIRPDDIVNNLHLISKSLRLGYQEDAHEFLAHLLDRTEVHCKSQALPICHVLRGELLSTVTCAACNGVSKKLDPFETLSLEIEGMSDLHHALRHFCASETLDGNNKYRCEGRCGNVLVRTGGGGHRRCPFFCLDFERSNAEPEDGSALVE